MSPVRPRTEIYTKSTVPNKTLWAVGKVKSNIIVTKKAIAFCVPVLSKYLLSVKYCYNHFIAIISVEM